jgi:hypothetical protein
MKLVTTNKKAEEINSLHHEICEGLRTMVSKAIRIGELLVQQKRECVHGTWVPWLEGNVEFSVTSARVYMRCYYHRGRLKQQPTAVLTIEDLARTSVKPAQEELNEEKQRQKELDDKAEVLAKERITLEREERDLQREREEKAVIEIDFGNIEEEIDFEQEVVLDETEEQFEERVQRLEEKIRKSEIEDRQLQNVPEAKIANLAQRTWKAIYEHYYRLDKIKIARAVIKMLYKKYPQLMDETI